LHLVIVNEQLWAMVAVVIFIIIVTIVAIIDHGCGRRGRGLTYSERRRAEN
jgi:hypothetical protein